MRLYGMQFDACSRIYHGITAIKCGVYKVFTCSSGFQSENNASSTTLYKSNTFTKAISICGSNWNRYSCGWHIGYICRKCVQYVENIYDTSGMVFGNKISSSIILIIKDKYKLIFLFYM